MGNSQARYVRSGGEGVPNMRTKAYKGDMRP